MLLGIAILLRSFLRCSLSLSFYEYYARQSENVTYTSTTSLFRTSSALSSPVSILRRKRWLNFFHGELSVSALGKRLSFSASTSRGNDSFLSIPHPSSASLRKNQTMGKVTLAISIRHHPESCGAPWNTA